MMDIEIAQPFRHRPGGSIADRGFIYPYDGHHQGARAGEEGLAGSHGLGHGKGSFLNRQACLARQFDEAAAGDAACVRASSRAAIGVVCEEPHAGVAAATATAKYAEDETKGLFIVKAVTAIRNAGGVKTW